MKVTTNQAVAAATLLGIVAITVGDAPDWRVEPYIGLIAAMTGVTILGIANPGLGKSLALLVATVMVLQRGERLLNIVTGFVE